MKEIKISIKEEFIKLDSALKLANLVATGGHAKFVIQNGEVFMENSNCKNQICVKHKKISRSGESIICLPNKVIIQTK